MAHSVTSATWKLAWLQNIFKASLGSWARPCMKIKSKRITKDQGVAHNRALVQHTLGPGLNFCTTKTIQPTKHLQRGSVSTLLKLMGFTQSLVVSDPFSTSGFQLLETTEKPTQCNHLLLLYLGHKALDWNPGESCPITIQKDWFQITFLATVYEMNLLSNTLSL